MMTFWIYFESDPENPVSVEAFRMEGWNRDYAFFADSQSPRDPTLVVPRDRVLRVQRTWGELPRDETQSPPEALVPHGEVTEAWGGERR